MKNTAIKNFWSFVVYNKTDDTINNTADFLAFNKSSIEIDCKDYQNSLFYLFYNQTYICYENLLREYQGQKNKIEILETRLNNTINRIVNLYSENRLQDILLFNKNQIDLTIASKYKTTKLWDWKGVEFIPDTKKTAIDKLNDKMIVEYIIGEVWLENYKFLINYFDTKNQDKKTKSEENKTAYNIKKLKNKLQFLEL